MKSVFAGPLLTVLVVSLSPANTSAQSELVQPCEAPEVITEPTNEQYNQLVCDGIGLIESGQFSDAAMKFEQALEIMLFEVPNFRLYPRLAIAYARAGRAADARRALETARLTLHVYTRILECAETNEGFTITSVFGPVEGPEAATAAQAMCGGMFEDYYRAANLRAVLLEAELVNLYFRAAEIVESVQDR